MQYRNCRERRAGRAEQIRAEGGDRSARQAGRGIVHRRSEAMAGRAARDPHGDQLPSDSSPLISLLSGEFTGWGCKKSGKSGSSQDLQCDFQEQDGASATSCTGTVRNPQPGSAVAQKAMARQARCATRGGTMANSVCRKLIGC